MNPAQLNLNPISQLDPVVIVAVIVLMFVTYFALRRVFVMPYLRVMDERSQLFELADERHRQAGDAVREADYESERALTEAAAAAEQLRADARERAETYRRERVEEATATASERLERGRADIATEKAIEVEALRSQAIDCVDLACGQLIGGASDEVVQAAVDRLLSRRIQ